MLLTLILLGVSRFLESKQLLECINRSNRCVHSPPLSCPRDILKLLCLCKEAVTTSTSITSSYNHQRGQLLHTDCPSGSKKKLCLVFYWYFVPYKKRKDKVRVWHSLAPFCEWRVSHWQYAINKCLLKGGVKHLHFLLFKKVSGSFENELKLLMQCCVVCCTTYGY